jgi:uncharacterized cupin superfamily protein
MPAKRNITVERIPEEQLKDRGVWSWPIWTKEISRFDWHYDEQEQCYFLDGDVTVETPDGPVHFGKGDFVTFPEGLTCVWDVKQPVRKHYKFG